jgi:DNA-binding MarR family transcriptional regulator
MIAVDEALGCRSTVQEKLAWVQARWPGMAFEAAGLVLHLARTRDLLFARSRSVLDVQGLAPAEFEALLNLLKQPEPHQLTPGAIASAIGLSSGGMTKALNKLVERGLISRAISPADRRSRLVRLTPEGIALAEATLQTIIQRHGTIMADILSAEERQQLTALLEKLMGSMESAESR